MSQSVYELYELYVQQMCGVRFVQPQKLPHTPNRHFTMRINDTICHCHLCARSKVNKPTLGYIKPESNLIFIVETPMGDTINNKEVLFDSRGAQMLTNIASNVFKQHTFSVLSLVKCGNEHPQKDEIQLCKPYIIEQLKQLAADKVVIFGDLALEMLLGLDSAHKGVILDFLDKKAIATFSLTQLLRNPTLKKNAMEHFLSFVRYFKH